MNNNLESKYWFKWVKGFIYWPISKEGYLIVFLYILLVIGAFFYYQSRVLAEEDTLMKFLANLGLLSFIYYLICRLKS